MKITPLPISGPKPFMRLSIAHKLILGFAAMAFFMLAALTLSLLGLLSINGTAREIAQTDLTVISSLARLRNSLISQEGYAGRYAIFKSPEFVQLFHQREKESLEMLGILEKLAPPQESRALKEGYRAYGAAASRLFAGEKGSTGALRAHALRLIDAVDALSKKRESELQAKLRSADRQQRFTIRGTILISLSGFFLALVVAAFSTFRISRAVRTLQRATHRIARGEFDIEPQIPPGDEIGDLAQDFMLMAQRLKALERANLDASPLTRLPGNAAIERELEERLKSGSTFAFCYADLDNFKAYSDRYGYAKGSEMIRLTGDLIYQETMSQVGERGFVGHIGGDDFVMVLPESAAATVCQAVIAKLDAEIVKHYNEEDVASGGIIGIDRYGVQRFFPMITVSIAVVLCEPGKIGSAVDLARVTAELKDYVKEKPGSSYSVKRYHEAV